MTYENNPYTKNSNLNKKSSNQHLINSWSTKSISVMAAMAPKEDFLSYPFNATAAGVVSTVAASSPTIASPIHLT